MRTNQLKKVMHAKFHISQFPIFKDARGKKEILFPAVVYHFFNQKKMSRLLNYVKTVKLIFYF